MANAYRHTKTPQSHPLFWYGTLEWREHRTLGDNQRTVVLRYLPVGLSTGMVSLLKGSFFQFFS